MSGVLFVSKAIPALFCEGATNGIMIDINAQGTTFAAVWDGHAMNEAIGTYPRSRQICHVTNCACLVMPN